MTDQMSNKEKIKALLVDMVAVRNYCSCCIGKMNPTAFKKYDKIAERAEKLLKTCFKERNDP